MTTAGRVVAVCGLAAAGEVGLWAATITDWSGLFPGGLVLAVFLVGPAVFLALLAWRRRGHPLWPRRFLVLALLLAAGGLGVLGWDCYRHHTDAAFRTKPNMDAVIVPFVQWAVLLAVWAVVVVGEVRDKRAAAGK